MSGWTPKVGDKVMVGKCGPYFVHRPLSHSPGCWDLRNHLRFVAKDVPSEWLTPASEPEPDKPTAPGALVRDGEGRILVLDQDGDWAYVTGPYPGAYDDWDDIARPVTVVLADPAEVEQLRAEVGVLREQSDSFLTQRDELQRRIDKVLSKDREWGGVLYEAIRQILRGDS